MDWGKSGRIPRTVYVKGSKSDVACGRISLLDTAIHCYVQYFQNTVFGIWPDLLLAAYYTDLHMYVCIVYNMMYVFKFACINILMYVNLSMVNQGGELVDVDNGERIHVRLHLRLSPHTRAEFPPPPHAGRGPESDQAHVQVRLLSA